MRQWKAGLVAALLSGVLGVGCGGEVLVDDSTGGAPMEASTEESAVDRYLTEMGGEDGNQCGKKICFDIERDKNITHIFLDFGKCHVKDFYVFLKTEHRDWENVTDRLKTQGGPCQELNADYRFEVQGPDKEAKVCIIFKDKVPKKLRIGAKSADECRYDISDHLFASGGDDECKMCK